MESMGLTTRLPPWEELEFLVDSCASVTMVGDESVKAVQASDANKGRQYKLADASYIPRKGSNTFAVVTDYGLPKQITAWVADVDTPLRSVAQIVRAGSAGVFHRDGSYVQDENGGKCTWSRKGCRTPCRCGCPVGRPHIFRGRPTVDRKSS